MLPTIERVVIEPENLIQRRVPSHVLGGLLVGRACTSTGKPLLVEDPPLTSSMGGGYIFSSISFLGRGFFALHHSLVCDGPTIPHALFLT